MNLINFLRQTDAITAQYSVDQFSSFIHDIGRMLPEHDREDFLKRLQAVGKEADKEPNKALAEESEFDEIYKRIRNNLEVIDSQKVTLQAVWNEEYDEWHDDSDDEFDYEDRNGISDMLTEACHFVHTCMDMEKYREGFEVGKQLLAMEILCDSEYGDHEFKLKDMVYHKLLQCDLRSFVLDTAYCACRIVSLKKRSEALYKILVGAGKCEVTLEAIMQHGDEEMSDCREFLPLWITCLGSKTGNEAQRLISEAVDLLNDASMAVRYAEEYVEVHPGIFLQILDNDKYIDEIDMVSIGMKAIRIMPKKYIMRSKVALKTAECVMEADVNPSLLEKCYFTAFESDTSAMNYLRALFNGYGTVQKREELQKVFMSLPVHRNRYFYGMPERSYSISEREENKPDSNMILLLKFLDGQFADVLARGLNKSEALGWSGTFMKQGIALYLLYLFEGKWSDKGIAAMAGMVKREMSFSKEVYQRGIKSLHETDEQELFCDVFMKWKSMTQMEADVRSRAINKITRLLQKRTEGIMGANRRNYYGECAAYIAALGEVQESLGDAGAKQRIMTSYKEKYSRRNAFRAELRNYGWIDSKRK